MGVDAFFIISGFVIFMTIQKVKNWKEFVWSRFSRLYPAYWICVTITTIAIILNNHFISTHASADGIVVRYFTNMTMFQYYFSIQNIDNSYWTLIIEIGFYFSMLLLLVKDKIRYIEKIGYACLLFCMIYHFDVVCDNYFFHKLLIIFPLIKYFPLFFAGILLYKMKFEKITAFRLLILVLTLIIQCFIFRNYYNIRFVSINSYILTLIFIYLIFILYLFNALQFISNPVTMWLGKISYSLYLIHQFIGIRIVIPYFINDLHCSFWLSAIIALIIVLFLAYMINMTVEIPATKYLRKIYNEKKNLVTAEN